MSDRKEQRQARRENRKPFSETKVGQFLKDKAPALLNKLGDALPSNGVFGLVKGFISKSDELKPEDKAHALELAELDQIEMREVSARWISDNQSDMVLPKIVRPVIVLFTWVFLTFMFIMAYAEVPLPVEYVSLFTTLALAVNAAYFGARTIEKFRK